MLVAAVRNERLLLNPHEPNKYRINEATDVALVLAKSLNHAKMLSKFNHSEQEAKKRSYSILPQFNIQNDSNDKNHDLDEYSLHHFSEHETIMRLSRSQSFPLDMSEEYPRTESYEDLHSLHSSEGKGKAKTRPLAELNQRPLADTLTEEYVDGLLRAIEPVFSLKKLMFGSDPKMKK